MDGSNGRSRQSRSQFLPEILVPGLYAYKGLLPHLGIWTIDFALFHIQCVLRKSLLTLDSNYDP